MNMRLQLAGFLAFVPGALPAWAQQPPSVRATPLLRTTTTVTGQSIVYPQKSPEVTATLVEISPGASVGWHEHPNIRYVYVIDGTLTIEMDDGSRRDYPAGGIFVEAYGTRHRGMNAGAIPVKVLFIDHSEAGASNMVKTEAPVPGHAGHGPDDQH
ncbi:MAG: cupin domain-containing protein [Beijerinckiaceae bacterium]|nr:cupin domain-containing protein [Beijerinckiaceae bacterium]